MIGTLEMNVESDPRNKKGTRQRVVGMIHVLAALLSVVLPGRNSLVYGSFSNPKVVGNDHL